MSGNGGVAIASVGSGSTSGTRVDVTLKLPQLQNLCKRDPSGYRDDYDAQIRRLKSECGILALSPSSTPSESLIELIQFAAAVSSSSYKGKESDEIAQLLIRLLVGDDKIQINSSDPNVNKKNKDSSLSMLFMNTDSNNAVHLHKDIRKACVSALILMRNKGAVQPLTLLHLFFQIMATVPDKSLKQTLYHHIVNDIKNVNKKGKRDDKLNRSVQTFLHKIIVNINQTFQPKNKNNNSNNDSSSNYLSDDHPLNIAARRAVDMVCDLYRKNVWTSDHTVAIIASAVQSPITNVMARAIRFFLNIEEKMEFDRLKKEENEWGQVASIDLHLHSSKTRKRKRRVGRDLKERARMQKKRENEDALENEMLIFERDKGGVEASRKLYPAIELINDPQGLAEHLLKKIKNSNSSSCKFEVKLLMINFVTRLVGNHELILLPLYPLLQRYMGGHQKDVTMIMAYTVQACHEYVPPQEIYAILKTIAHNFITERCSGEQMAVGINAVRAICNRVPSVLSIEVDSPEDTMMEEDATSGEDKKSSSDGISKLQSYNYTVLDVEAFARDLAAYAKHRDRSVAIAGKGWSNFIREVYPTLLQGKDRGMVGSALHKAGEKPMRYGERKVADGVEGADLLIEYESKKAEYLRRKKLGEIDSDDEWDSDDDGIQEEPMNDEEFEEVEEDDDDDNDDDDDDEEGWVEMEDEEEDEAPDLVKVTENKDGSVSVSKADGEEDKEGSSTIDLKSMSAEERKKLVQDVSSTRVFTTADFEKMRKLVEREKRLRRDPRAAAKRKRALAQGKDFEELSDDDSDVDDEEEGVSTHGVVNPMEIMANAKKKRMNKAERLEKIIAGREKFHSKVSLFNLSVLVFVSHTYIYKHLFLTLKLSFMIHEIKFNTAT